MAVDVRAAPPPRLALLRAARAPVAVILRRGPSKWTEIIRWDMSRDLFERGQWFHGRIYEKRSDLSPDGELLAVFAAKYGHQPSGAPVRPYAWTAVSRPPWLTALALWPKADCWWGGALFTADDALWLNHRPEESIPHPEHRPKTSRLTVTPNPDARGEDEPIYRRRLDRDGWTLRTEWTLEHSRGGFRTLVPDERARPDPLGRELAIVLTRRIDSLAYRESFAIEGAKHDPELPPGPLNWLDWDARGRLVALSGGRVWAAEVEDGNVQRFRELLDLRDDEPTEREAPQAATHW
jgi:hypothetical protein